MKVGIIGAGPGGMFAAHTLIKEGIEVILFEQGKPMINRVCNKVSSCSCQRCDILEGVGGAGGFSDGKNVLSSGRGTGDRKDIFSDGDNSLIQEINEYMKSETDTFEHHDVPVKTIDSGLFEFDGYAVTHFGTDGIIDFILKMERTLLSYKNLTFKREMRVRNVQARGNGYWIEYDDGYVLVDKVIFATGIAGHPWVDKVLSSLGSVGTAGTAGFGIRFEGDSEVLAPLFDLHYDFKLKMKVGDIQLRSFCCNRNGHITNENHRELGVINVNGHSFHSKTMKTNKSNFAIIAMLDGERYGNPQDSVVRYGRKCNLAVAQRGGKLGTGVQSVEEFLTGSGSFPNYSHKQAFPSDLKESIPVKLSLGFKIFISGLSKWINVKDNVIYFPEIKYFGRKIEVEFDSFKMKSSLGLEGIYVPGNANGHLDSFVACAVSGIKSSRNIIGGI